MKPICLFSALLVAGLWLTACSDDPVKVGSSDLGPVTGVVVDGNGTPVAGATILIRYEMVDISPDKPTTRVEYVLPESGRIHLWITSTCSDDVLRTLVDGEVPAGTHTVTWDMCDDFGLTVPDGVYRYHLDTESDSSSDDFLMRTSTNPVLADLDLCRPLAVTDQDGRFTLDQDCLGLGFETVDFDGIGLVRISPTIRLWALHADHATPWFDTVTVNEKEGAQATIVLPD